MNDEEPNLKLPRFRGAFLVVVEELHHAEEWKSL